MRIGFDSRLHTPRGLDKLRKVCEERGAELVPVTDNPVDAVWATQPPPPLGPAVPHPIEFAGTSVAAKRTLIADQLGREGDAAAVLTAPDSIAWLLNIRGADVPHTPLPLSFATIDDRGDVNLFLDPRKLTPEAHAHLGNDVVVQPPEAFGPHLDKLGHGGRVVRVDPAAASVWVFDRLHRAGATIRRDADPCALPKACKNAEELEGARAAHRRDAVAICRFLRWLSVKGPSGELTETGVVDRLLGFRSELPLFRDVSFDTIAGTGPNAAICHYRVTAESSRRVEPGALLLVDSGAQFLDGTTDITRTVAIGAPTPAMRRRFTLVLKGHIALATARFPEGTTGAQLDPFARQFLWRAGLDYDHGTGHGVGSYLSVHEGPQRLSKMPNGVALQPGMIVSNEPGYYEDNAYGIRIENLIAVRRATDVPDAPRPVLEFETLTLAPIDRSLVEPSLLTADELGWLNDYHARVRAVVGPQLTDEDKAWLEAVTEPIMPGASSTP